MTAERRYSEEEVKRIFQAAAEGPSTASQQLARSEGMTLADLQAIGAEVGLSPEAIAHAAQTLEVRQGAVNRTLLGLPIGVERRVTLNRHLTDAEWERLVVQFRDAFKARGRTKTEGSLRQWTNGNLYALLEPTPTGDRLRLGSLHGAATASMRMGLLGLGAAAVLALANLLFIRVVDPGTVAVLLAGGAALLANGALRLRGWARLRGNQMEDLAAQLTLPPGSTTPS